MKAGLFDVLTGEFAGNQPLDAVAESDYLRMSVLSNLNYLFNCRRGSLEHLPDYGLPDITEIYRESPDSVVRLRKSLKEAIEKYEPRLRRVRVDPQDANPYEMRLVFLVSGELPNREPVRFRTTFSSVEAARVRPWR